jgi:hypothetical protein
MFTGRATLIGNNNQTGFARSGATIVRRIFEQLGHLYRGAFSIGRFYLFMPFILSSLFTYDLGFGHGFAERFHFGATTLFTLLSHCPFVH